MKKKKITIFGGGIAGLTVAHECIEAGFDVTLYEKKDYFGGKAYGYRDEKGFPVEHAARIYLSIYLSLFESLKRIPVDENKTVFDHIVPLKGIFFSYNNKANLIPLDYSKSIFHRLKSVVSNQRDWGLSWLEIARVFAIVLSYVLKCEKRKQNTIWKQSFIEYHKLEECSPKFREYLETLFNQFVAARSHTISAILDDLLFKLFNFKYNPFNMPSFGCATNGPTNEAIIDPWVKYLAKRGVHFELNTPVVKLDIQNQQVKGAYLEKGERVESDVFVLAMPYAEIQALVPELHLTKKVNLEWSMGFQLYLNKIPPKITQEKAFFNIQDSPWKIIYILEGESLWEKMEYPSNIKAVLSGVITNIHRPGALYKKSLFECRPEEIKEEILTQIGLKNTDAVSSFSIDPTLHFLHSSEIAKEETKYKGWSKGPLFPDGYQWVFESPLFIEKPNELKRPITANTEIHNLFLAGDHLKTSFYLPTMERASESGKLCAEKIFEKFGLQYPKSRYQRPKLPFGWIRAIDYFIYSIFG